MLSQRPVSSVLKNVTCSSRVILLLLATAILWSLPQFAQAQGTLTPIRHVVVIFQENVSFDHYFATYPHALNPAVQPKFTAWANNPPPARNELLACSLPV